MRSEGTARLALYDLRDNIVLAQSFVAGLSSEEFKASRLIFYATTRALEIISEAARRLPDELRDRHAHLPWRSIMGAGKIYRHDYDNVVEDFVWRTVHDSLPTLLSTVTTEIEALDRP